MVTIRQTRSSDLPRIAEIYGAYVRDTVITFDEQEPALAEWEAKLAAAEASGWPFRTATDDDGSVLGYAYLAPFRGKSGWRYAAENSIYLAPEATGRGLGSQLLSRLMVDGEAAGVRSIVAVIVDHDTAASQALHARAGFVEQGRLRDVGWKFNSPHGVILMVKYLGGHLLP